MFLAISLLNLVQTDLSQWAHRPGIECDNGDAVHRYAAVNATRVNIRDLPTVFSNVLTKKCAGSGDGGLRIWGLVANRSPRDWVRDLDIARTDYSPSQATTVRPHEACIPRSTGCWSVRSLDSTISTTVDFKSHRFIITDSRIAGTC